MWRPSMAASGGRLTLEAGERMHREDLARVPTALTDWLSTHPFDEGLGDAPVMDLAISPGGTTVHAATLGGGVFEYSY